VQESSYLISKAPRHRSIIIPSCADEMPLNITSITSVFGNLEVVCFMNLGLPGRLLDEEAHIFHIFGHMTGTEMRSILHHFSFASYRLTGL